MASQPSAPPPENTIIFEVDRVVCKSAKSLSTPISLPSLGSVLAESEMQSLRNSSSGSPQILDFSCSTSRTASSLERALSLSSDSASLDASPLLHGFLTITADVNTKRSGRTLSTLTFDDDSTFSADEAAMICKITSDFAKEDNIIGFWYAWAIYNVIQQTQKGCFTKTPAEDDRRIDLHSGVNKGASVFDISQRIVDIYREEWPKWMADIENKKLEMDEEERRCKEAKQEVIRLKQIDVEQKQELDRLKEEFAKLQKGNEAI
ncbi:hypothetical protein ARMGADRAFT_1089704 [Armillaria gallica]|uniref:Uncharacterized protein n=1 Tax=Armillaria gallica TaxID=47427 RepID=A0A2H3CJ91_ARMGA|nr:hypothetical protein ARMGADRAFT_1089704 [Armillaria gallica]